MILTQAELDSLAVHEAIGPASGASPGNVHQRSRIELLAGRACSQMLGDLVEIGCYAGDTSAILAQAARKWDRKLVCFDSFRPGTDYDLDGSVMKAFMEKQVKYSDVMEFHRLDAHSPEAVEIIQQRRYAFAFSDNGHEVSDHIQELEALLPVTDGVVIVDDVYIPELMDFIEGFMAQYPEWKILKNARLCEAYFLKGAK